MKTTETMAKPTTVTPTMVMPTKVTPTMVMPELASQDVAATFWSQADADKCNAVADVKIPRWDPAFKIPSLRKAKMEMPKTYMELVTLQEVLDSISNHMSVGCNSKEKLEIMKTTLKIQFNNYELSWENSMWDVSDEVFYEFEELYLTITEAVDKVNAALFESKKFLREKSIQRGRDCNGDLKEDRNRDTKSVQKRPRWSKKTKSVQERPRVSKNVQEDGHVQGDGHV